MQGYVCGMRVCACVWDECTCVHVANFYLYCISVSRFECVIQSVPSHSLVQCGVGI